MRRDSLSSCAALVLSLTAASALGQVTFQKIAGTGDVPPGRTGVVFRAETMWRDNDMPGVFSRPAINDNGVVVFLGESCNAFTYTNTAKGIYAYVPGETTPLRVLADTTAAYSVPGCANSTFTDFRAPLINNNGDVLFWASFYGACGSHNGLFATRLDGAVTSIKLLASTQTAVPGLSSKTFAGFTFGTGTWQSWTLACLNDNGQVVFNGFWWEGSSKLDGLYSTTVAGGAIQRLVDPTGTIYPTGDSRAFTNIDDGWQPALNNAGLVLFRGIIGSYEHGLFVVPADGSAAPRTVAVQGASAAPPLSDGTARTWYSWFNGFDLNDAGQFVFYHSFDDTAVKEAIYYGSVSVAGVPTVAGVLVDTAGSTTLPGRTELINELGVPLLDESGRVSFYAGGGGLGAQCVGYLSGLPTRLAAIKGGPLPARDPNDCKFLDFALQTGPLNDSGNVALTPQAWNYAGVPNPYSIHGAWFYSLCAGSLSRVVDDATAPLALPNGLSGTLSPTYGFIKLYQGHFARSGHCRALNNSNQVAFLAAFSSAAVTGGIFVADVPAGSGLPSITCPTNATLEYPPSDVSPGVTGTATAFDACTNLPLTPTFADTSTPGCGLTYTISRAWTATNSAGQSASCTQTIAVVDTTAPHLVPPADITVECGTSTDPNTTGLATATDAADPAPAVTYADLPTGTCPVVVTRTWTARDACGNSTSAAQIITVADTTSPVLTVPPDAEVPCGSPTDPNATGYATATDACDPAPHVTFSDASSGACPVITRTWTAVDACGRSISRDQTIAITDTTPPVFTVAPQNRTVECDGMGNVLALNAWLAEPQATDTCSVPTMTDNFQAAGQLTCGSTVTVTWTATDACGNTATASASFNVVDTTFPTLTCPADLVVNLPANACAATGLALGNAVAGDTCGAVAVSNNAPSEFPP
ncbi:MAG: HYR domain-containing protein, partial [Planctomycetota bacterium]